MLFSLQDFAEAAHQVSGLPFCRLPQDMVVGGSRPAKFDLSVFISPTQERISGYINYATSLFASDSISRMITIYQRVLEALVTDTQQSIGSIACLSQAQNETLLYDWSGYNAVTPTAPVATLHQAFEAQVAKTPQSAALVFENVRLSYQQLDQQANQLADLIQSQYHQRYQQAMAAGTPIALYLDRSVTMVVSILAVLKAGGAYVPLSPEHPKARSEFILNDIQAPFVLTDSVYAPKLRDWLSQLEQLNTKVLIAAQLPQDLAAQNINSPLTLQSCDTDLAYVIYTSGTTGQPKGVGVSHGASVLRNLDMAQQGQTEQNCYLLTTNYIFDVCVSDLFSHLLVGATVVLTRSVFDVAEIQHLLATHPINACHFVPSQFSAFMAGQSEPLSLARLYFSGEDLTPAQLTQIDFNQTQVINYYGPTETGEATSYIVPDVHGAHIIGRPLAGVQVYVVQNGQTLAPVGTPGELYIGGIGLAEGYFNRPDLTQAAYIVTHKDSPLVTDKLKIDLATLLPTYMLPASFTQIAAIPLTINGKLDRRALPNPVFVSDVAYVRPRNQLEQQLCDIWQATLEVEQVGIYDRFFDIGGNSIIAIRLTAVMRRTLAMDIPLVLLFEQQTVAGIAGGLMANGLMPNGLMAKL